MHLHKPFWNILETSGQLHMITKDYLFLPSKFELSTKTYPTPPISRGFCFQEMSEYNFCKLVKQIHDFVTTSNDLPPNTILKSITRYILEIECVNGECCTVQYDFVKSSVFVTSYENDPKFPVFCAAVTFLGKYFVSDSSLKRCEPFAYALCVCVNCMETGMHGTIPMNQIESVAASGTAFIYCRDIPVRLDLLAPDVSLGNLEHMMVEYSELEIIKKVGEGGFATVFLGKYEGKEIAVKKLDLEKKESLGELFAEFRHEVSLMAGLVHPNTCGLIGLCKKPLCVLTEFCACGDLFSYIATRKEQNRPFPHEYIMHVLLDIAKGMNFLHRATPPILHRDLKTPNILLCRKSYDDDDDSSTNTENTVIAKISDFGLSMKTIGPVTERVVDNPLWLAPELLNKQPYS